MTVTGTQLERMIQRGKALAADVRQRYEASGQDEPAAAQPIKKRKKASTCSGHTTHCISLTLPFVADAEHEWHLYQHMLIVSLSQRDA